jgi:hypothetical protein
MTDELDPRDEEQLAQRSLGAALIQAAEVIGGGAVGGVTGALTSHWLEGNQPTESEPPPPTVVLPPGVHVDDD